MKILIVGDNFHERLLKHQLEDRGIICDIIKYKGKKDLIGLLCFLVRLRSYDVVYRIWGAELNIWIILAKIFRKKTVIHWIGTDTYNVSTRKSSKRVCLFMSRFVNQNFSVSMLLKKELNDIGLNSDIIPILPEYISCEIDPLLQEHAFLSYIPIHREEFYNKDLVMNLARYFSHLKFYIVANDGSKTKNPPPNVIFLGYVDEDEMDEIYSKISILLRIVKHDGLPKMVLESLIKGKQVIYNYQFPYCTFVEDLENMKDLVQCIIQNKPILNMKGHKYMINEFNKETIISDLLLKLKG